MNPDANEELEARNPDDQMEGEEDDQPEFEDQEEEEEDQDDTSINEDLYNSIMQSINKVWPDFNQADGVIGEQEFPDIMIKIATD